MVQRNGNNLKLILRQKGHHLPLGPKNPPQEEIRPCGAGIVHRAPMGLLTSVLDSVTNFCPEDSAKRSIQVALTKV